LKLLIYGPHLFVDSCLRENILLCTAPAWHTALLSAMVCVIWNAFTSSSNALLNTKQLNPRVNDGRTVTAFLRIAYLRNALKQLQ